MHRFYQEPYQLNGGAQNRYVTGSDAIGLTMGVYDTTALPLYAYLHAEDHPNYVIEDNFFQAAFGGSFLNHHWLIAAATPNWPGIPASQHSVVDSNGMPNKYSLYTPTGPVSDRSGTVDCAAPHPPDWRVVTTPSTRRSLRSSRPVRSGPRSPSRRIRRSATA